MTIGRLSLLASTLLMLTGCFGQPRLEANVEVVSALTGPPSPLEVAVRPMGDMDPDGLDFRLYRQRLETTLASRGFDVVSPADEATWIMSVGYGSDGGREITQRTSVPLYYGYGDRFRYPRYHTVETTRTVFTRHLELALNPTKGGDEVWRSRVVSVSRCPSRLAVFDAMAVAALSGFPNAGTQRLDMELQERC